MADTLESLEIEVKHSATGAAGEIGSVANALHDLSIQLLKVLPDLKELATVLSKVKGNININLNGGSDPQHSSSGNPSSWAQEMTKVVESQDNGALANFRDVLDTSGLESAQQSLRSEMEQTQEVFDNALGSMSNDLQEVIRNASEVDVLRAKLESLNVAMENALASGNMDKAYSFRAQILSTEKALARAEKAARGTAGGIKEISKEAKKTKSPLGNFADSLKRIAYYRIIRGILKSVGQAFKEGLEKAYLFSSGIEGEGHRFADALDRMKSAGNAMKGQLGAAFIGLLAAIEPILTAIINLIIRVADAISQLLAAFTGRTYLKATATAAKFSDEMERGAGAAKEWKNQILGFDELNRLNEPSGGGGGGGSPLDGYNFEDAPISEYWLGIADKLRPIFGDIEGMFKGLRDFVTGVFTGDWELAFQGLGDIVSNFGSLVNHALQMIVGFFDGFSGQVIEIVSDLFDWISEKTGIDLTEIKRAVLFVLNTIRFVFEGNMIQMGYVFQDLCDTISYLIKGDFDNAFLSAKKMVSDASADVIGSAIKMAAEVTNSMMEGGDATNDFSETFSTNMESVRSEVEETNRIQIDGGGIFGGLISWAKGACDWIQNVLTGIGFLGGYQTDAIGGAVRGALAQLPHEAGGGFVDDGQLFVAREAGPELVGTMNGRTAVANNDQIVEGIRQGVFEAVSAAMSNGNNGNGTEFKLFLDSREIKFGLERLDRAWGA